jgi:hypothetical protein
VRKQTKPMNLANDRNEYCDHSTHGLGESSFGFWVIRVDGNRGLPRWLQISSLVQLWISILVLAGYRFWGSV